MTNELIESFIEKWLEFDLQVRQKEGVDELLFEELVELLSEINASLEGKDSIPKNLAEIFVDMYGALASSAEMYEGMTQQRVYEVASRLCDHARDICTG
jgi:uncharacterized protein with von Willebrand factor type A (vWA) domain